jgi:glycerol kinase
MDAIPIEPTFLSLTEEPWKAVEPVTQTQHVEHIDDVVPVEGEHHEHHEHHEHLPQGITETEEEKTSHWFIGSIDCGTTSSRFLIFNGEGTPIASHQIEFENIYPESG